MNASVSANTSQLEIDDEKPNQVLVANPMAVLKSGKLDSITFDQLLSQQDLFNEGHSNFDLRQIQWISSAAIVQLSAACFALAKAGCTPVIQVNDSSVRSYLIRSEFLNAVESVALFHPPYSTLEKSMFGSSHGASPLLIEVTKIENHTEVGGIINKFLDILIDHLQYPKKDAYSVATIASEILQNTYDHNDNSCGFVAMQVYGQQKKRFIEMGVADFGYGIATTLARNEKNGPVTSDFDAIRKAIKLGTSEYDDPTRGNGLYHLCDITYKHQGTVQIRSGDATVRFRMDKPRGWGFTVVSMPGVQIALNLPIKVR